MSIILHSGAREKLVRRLLINGIAALALAHGWVKGVALMAVSLRMVIDAIDREAS